MCVLGFLGIGIKMLTEEGLIRLNKIFHYILRLLFRESSSTLSTTSLRLFRAARILIVRARIAHGEINVFDGANFITITVTWIIKLCYCSAVCLPSLLELRDKTDKKPKTTYHYLDRRKNRMQLLLLFAFL